MPSSIFREVEKKDSVPEWNEDLSSGLFQQIIWNLKRPEKSEI